MKMYLVGIYVIVLLRCCCGVLAVPHLKPAGWDFSMKEREITIRGDNTSRLAWVSLPESANHDEQKTFPVFLSLVIDPYYPKSMRNGTDVCKTFGPFDLPVQTLNRTACFSENAGGQKCGEFWGNCCFDSRAGSLWNQRIKQYLLANGVAVVALNPGAYGWNYPGSYWNSDAYGLDRYVFQNLFEQMSAGPTVRGDASSILSRLDKSRMVIRGFSGGAQMVSWLIQKWAEGRLADGVRIRGGVYLSGGSYECYNANNPRGVCKSCNASDSCDGPTQSCNLTAASPAPCCSYCCPEAFAEQYYEENPAEWRNHPPAFLAQLPVDYNADLCATSNYHETLLSHGVESHLHIDVKEDMDCYCFGRPGDSAARGSPFLDECRKKRGGGWYEACFPHAMGFASIVEPLSRFVLEKVNE
eukprot:g1925.t1